MKGLHDILKPSYISNNADHLRVNSELLRVIMAAGYPRSIREGWLDSLITSEGSFDLSMHISPCGIEEIIVQLNEELVRQEADLMSARIKGIVNPSLKIQHEDTLAVLDRLQRGQEKLFNLALYIACRADCSEKLESLSRKVCSEMNSIMIIPKIPFLKMKDAIKSVYPIAKDRLKVTRNIPGDALSACFPFTTAFFTPDAKGILFGVNRKNNVPIIMDLFSLSNYNGLILGTSGGGKSFAAKLIIMRSLLAGIRAIIIDPQGEYCGIAKAFGGQIIYIKRGCRETINPLELSGESPAERILWAQTLFSLMLGGLTGGQGEIITRALEAAYESKGVLNSDQQSWQLETPTLSAVLEIIAKWRKRGSNEERQACSFLYSRLWPHIHGSFMGNKTNVNLDKQVVCFSIAQMPDWMKPAAMFVIMEHVHKRMQTDKERKMLIIDEAWSLLRHEEHSAHIFELVKTARKFNLSVMLITQEAEDLLCTPAGKAVIANTAWKLLCRQDSAVIGGMREKFALSVQEQSFLLTAAPGEGLLFAMNERIPLKIIACEQEYALATTNPNETAGEKKQGWQNAK